jgi:hypothetical protein
MDRLATKQTDALQSCMLMHIVAHGVQEKDADVPFGACGTCMSAPCSTASCNLKRPLSLLPNELHIFMAKRASSGSQACTSDLNSSSSSSDLSNTGIRERSSEPADEMRRTGVLSVLDTRQRVLLQVLL